MPLLYSNAQDLSSDGLLREYTAEDETFFVNTEAHTTLRVSVGAIEQKYYDDMQRLVKIIRWKKNSDVIDSIVIYEYDGTSLLPSSSKSDFFATKKYVEEVFNADGKTIEKKVFTGSVVEDGDSAKNELLTTTYYVYDGEKNLIEERILYADKNRAENKIRYTIGLGLTKKDEYFYVGLDLQKSLIYQSQTDWEETVYLSKNLYYKTIYQNSLAVKEEVYENDVKVRENNL